MMEKEKKKKKPLKVIELFAGVGGFRVALENINRKNKNELFRVIWSNQWEPSTKTQHASEVYVKRFGEKGHSNLDIAKVSISEIPDHDLLVGGFPCQDYSVARTLSQAAGLVGKKGVLWWEIYRILKDKAEKAPNYLLLENVDRLIKSPAKQRGRDFAIMLSSLSDLGYIVEWRVLNAADYGMPQRRRRIFILAYKKGSKLYDAIQKGPHSWAWGESFLFNEFPGILTEKKSFELVGSVEEISEKFNLNSAQSPFWDSGVIVGRNIWTQKIKASYNGPKTLLNDVLVDEDAVPPEFFIAETDKPRWEYLKKAKKEERKTKDGFVYTYNEGGMAFPDFLDKPSRTIVTGEGGVTPSRFKHVILTSSGKLRRLLPVELERLCMFPDHHTEGYSAARRAFFMGNALVVGVVEKIAEGLIKYNLDIR